MNIIFFILLCVTYYIPPVISVDDEEITSLWNAIKGDANDYIKLQDFIVYYGEEEKYEFRVLTERFGTKCTNDTGQVEYRINCTKFTEAVLAGRIPRWPIPVLRDEFNKIASKGKYGLKNITVNDMKKYYEEEDYTSEQLDDIMAKFGVSSEGEWKLFFYDFTRAVNTGSLPEPRTE